MFEEEKTITLIKPVAIGKGEAAISYEELNLREPTAGELEKAARADTSIGVVINMISLVARRKRASAPPTSCSCRKAARCSVMSARWWPN